VVPAFQAHPQLVHKPRGSSSAHPHWWELFSVDTPRLREFFSAALGVVQRKQESHPTS